MKLLAIFLSLIALLATEFAKAQDGPYSVQVQVIRVSGTGCPTGSVAAALSPDQGTLSVLFDQLGTQILAGSGVLQDRKSCTLTLGIKFGGQYRMAIVGSDVRGFASVPSGAISQISVKHRSIFSPSDKLSKLMDFQKTIHGPSEQNIEMINRFPQKPMWSHCGTQMKYNTQIFPFMYVTIDVASQNQNSADDLVAMIDSFDFSSAPLSYQLAWKRDTKNCPR